MAVLKLWEKTWRNNGWEPVVLGEKDALAADEKLARQIMDAKNLYRSPNPKAYEMACYLRWVAMTARGGLMTDYDVMNRSFKPQDYANVLQKAPIDEGIFLAGGVPCAVGGTKAAFQGIVQIFLEFEAQPIPKSEASTASISDQNIFHDFQERYYRTNPMLCSHFGDANWESYPLTHFPHGKVHTKRAQTIQENFPTA